MSSHPRMIGIVAMTPQRVIGREGKLPWHYPEDLKFFRQTTTGHTLLMGRKTYESIGKPLPNRRNVVLSTTLEPQPGVEVIRQLADLYRLPDISSETTIFLIGGAQLFDLLLPQCDALYLTRVIQPHEGDVSLQPFEHLFNAGELISSTPELEIRYHQRLPA
jgi:dihydrofolate reductase